MVQILNTVSLDIIKQIKPRKILVWKPALAFCIALIEIPEEIMFRKSNYSLAFLQEIQN